MKKLERKPILLMILDGYGIGKDYSGNAVKNAYTPILDSLCSDYPHSYLKASGVSVGLPEGQIGNSEVGHLTIGAGRIVYTGLSLINKSIEDKSFLSNSAFLSAFDHVLKNKSKLHIMGLLSNGGVHSLDTHIFTIIEMAKEKNIPTVVHIFGDGRDVPPKSIKDSIFKLIKTINNSPYIKIGSISGRYYSMDRDKRWDRVQSGYDAIVSFKGNKFKDPVAYVDSQYAKNIYDEFLEPAVNDNFSASEICVTDNDAVIFANFRPDRARQMSHMLFNSDYYDYQPSIRRKNLYFTTMMQYEGIIPSSVAFPAFNLINTFGEVISNCGYKQLRIAETEKYAHVTFFFDGGKEIDFMNTDKKMIPSVKVATYDLKPEMSCEKIVDELLKVIIDYDFIILNFANPDMVGHTGNYDAVIKALEILDLQIKRIVDRFLEIDGTFFLTADHGNAEEMIDEGNQPVTKHTVNDVIFMCSDKSVTFKSFGTLADIAPTILDYANLSIPNEMTGNSLLLKK